MRTLQTLAAAVCLLLSSAAPAAQVEVDTAPPAATDQDARHASGWPATIMCIANGA